MPIMPICVFRKKNTGQEIFHTYTLADLHSKILDARPQDFEILSISCSFWENLAKLCVHTPPLGSRPHLGEILDPPLLYTSRSNRQTLGKLYMKACLI